MALGKQVISKILYKEINKSTVKHVRGCFTDARNYKIACRFYYHYALVGLQYEACLTQLNKEFDLSEIRLAQLIIKGSDHLKELKKDTSVRRTLKNKFPFFNWN